MEQETSVVDQSLPKAVPEKKKRTLTEKQIKNLEMMRQKKMAKKKAVEMIEESVRNSAREPEKSQREPDKYDEISNLKNELYELKAQISKKRLSSEKSKSPPVKRRKVVEADSSDEGESVSYQYVNPYLNQLIRGR